jgi:heterodisulfide reductase subunit C
MGATSMNLSQNELYIKDIMYKYAAIGITTIPVNEKKPCINWRPLKELTEEYDIYNRIEDMFKDKFNEVTGLAVLIGGENKGLSCVDIDSNDAEIVERVLKQLPSHINKIGRKGCSFFFYNECDVKSMYQYPVPSGGMIEIFYDNKYVVIPPSLHSRKGIEDYHYFWRDKGCTLLHFESIDSLPSISYEEIERLPILIGSPSTLTANKNLPNTIQYDVNGVADNRFNILKKVIGGIVARDKRVVSVSKIISEVLEFDAINFPKNSFFEYEHNKKHKEVKQGRDKYNNCLTFVNEILVTFHRDSPLSYVEEFSVPTEVEDIDNIKFRDFIPITLLDRATVTPEFKAEWIPTIWREAILDIEQSYGVPRQVMFFSMLTVLAGCLQAKIKVQPYLHDPWFCMTNFTCMILAPSGSKKSDVIKLATYEATKIQARIEKANPQEIIDEENMICARIEALVKERNKKASNGEEDEAKEISKVIYEEQDKLKKITDNLVQTEWLQELGTIQKMITDAANNQKNGMLLVIDEFNQIRQMKKKTGNEDAHNFFMRMVDGDKPFTMKTKKWGKERIDPCIGSILTAIQPDVYDSIIADLMNPRTDSDDGFMQRFPPINFGVAKLIRTKPLDFIKHKNAFDIFDHAFRMHPKIVNVRKDSWDRYEDLKFETRVRAKAQSSCPTLASYLYKHEGHVAKFGYFAAFLKHKGKELAITDEDLYMGWSWLTFMHDDLLNTFSITDNVNDIKEQLIIVEKIKNRVLIDGQTMSQWHQVARGTFKFLDKFNKHLDVLQARGYIKMIDIRENSRIIKVNPLVWLS